MDKIKLEFIHREILKGVRKVYRAQYETAAFRLRREGKDKCEVVDEGRPVIGRTGYLMRALQSPEMKVWQRNQSNHASLSYPMYIRFLDMKRMGNFKIYNRQIWGILYGETFPTICYGYTDEVRKWIKNNMEEIMNQLN